MTPTLRDAFTDLVKLAGSGTIPREIPAHYVRFAYGLHCQARGRKVPSVSIWDKLALSKPVRLPYQP